MALEQNIGGNGSLFVGEDKTFKLGPVFDGPSVLVDGRGYVPNSDGSASGVLSTVVNIATWDIRRNVRLVDLSSSVALPEKTATFEGVFNADQLLSTQRAVATYTDTELNTVIGLTYRYDWKRLNDGVETVLAWGDKTFQVSPTR